MSFEHLPKLVGSEAPGRPCSLCGIRKESGQLILKEAARLRMDT